MTLRRTRSLAAAIAVGLLIAAAAAARPYLRGAAFVVQASGVPGAARRAAAWATTSVTTGETRSIPWRGGSLRSRRYEPNHVSGRGILLLPGVHAAGIDEPRLVSCAHDLAS